MTVRFCKPGNARLPAGVHYVGFWTSHVAPDGTALEAFDAHSLLGLGSARLVGHMEVGLYVLKARGFFALKKTARILPEKAGELSIATLWSMDEVRNRLIKTD
jgi:hypothetical protein